MESPITGKRTGKVIIRSASQIPKDKYGFDVIDEYFAKDDIASSNNNNNSGKSKVFVLHGGGRLSTSINTNVKRDDYDYKDRINDNKDIDDDGNQVSSSFDRDSVIKRKEILNNKTKIKSLSTNYNFYKKN